jgi:antitoxin (DNA-binding transcriptional repressor) of toxin-antitoxin stability system
MQKATISQLKNRLSEYLKKVKAGQTILVLDRDEPVARLERVPAGGGTDERLARLERAGLLRRGGGKPDIGALRAPVPRPRASVVEALLEERREGR